MKFFLFLLVMFLFFFTVVWQKEMPILRLCLKTGELDSRGGKTLQTHELFFKTFMYSSEPFTVGSVVTLKILISVQLPENFFGLGNLLEIYFGK